MTGLDPNVKNVTVIHLTGYPNSVVEREIVDHGGENKNTINENNNESKFTDNNLLKDNMNSHNIYENLRYFYYPLNNNEFTQQNVGISGKISMACEPIYENCPCHFDDDSLVGPYSLMSVHESIIESCNMCQHYTTITIGKRNLMNLDLDSLCGPKIYFEESRPISKDSHASQTEMMKPIMINKEMQVNLDNITSHDVNVDQLMHQNIKLHHVTYDSNFQHKICENCCCDVPHDSDFDQDSISSFSSAYTVTECELATSESSSNHNHCCKFSPQARDTPNLIECNDETYFHEVWKRSINMPIKKSSNNTKNSNDILKNNDKTKKYLYKKNDRCYGENKFINNNNYFIYEEMLNYFFAQMEQKDKNEDEIWISNEATFSTNVATKNVDFSLHFAIPPKVFPQINPKVQGCGSTDQNNKFSRCLSAVTFDQRESEDASVTVEEMTAFLPASVCDTQQRNHFTNRQRITESLSNYVEGKGFWNKENRLSESKEVNSTAQLTSTVDNRPTKRFSFLVRSNSVTQGGNKELCKVTTSELTKNGKQISPSDKAILDRLSELKITPHPPATTTKVPQPSKNTHTQKNPSCGRCGEPVYPQELIKPTEELYFHSACFKCQQCGIKLNLRTFFRCASPTKDSRIFCKVHLPPSDVRKANSDNITTVDNKEIIKCDPVGLRYF